jgi:hypothetical protein
MSVSIHDPLFKQLPSPVHCPEGGLRQPRSASTMYLVSKALRDLKKFKWEQKTEYSFFVLQWDFGF